MSDPPRYILFLPPPPSPSTLSSLKSAFGDTLSQVLKEVASHSSTSSKAAILEVASACPVLVGAQKTPRSQLFAPVQDVVAGIYRVISVIAARENIDIEDADGVDVRVLLVAWSTDTNHARTWTGSYGPVVDFWTLARCGRQWQYAFGVESEAGEAMVKAFIAAKEGGGEIRRVQSGPEMSNAVPGSFTGDQGIGGLDEQGVHVSKTHNHVAVGGTFDHLHIGHKLLLTMTVFLIDEADTSARLDTSSQTVTIGITGDALLTKKKYAEVLESWSDRQIAVQTFIDSILNFSSHPPGIHRRDEPGPNGKSVDLHYGNGLVVKCTEIQDPFGPTITEEWISALVISAETREGGRAVNEKREEKGWVPLDVFEVHVLDAEEDGGTTERFQSKLSSTAIREKLSKKTADMRQ